MGALAAAVVFLPPIRLRFCGFLPVKTSQRQKMSSKSFDMKHARWCFTKRRIGFWKRWKISPAVLKDRPVVIARELTKLHEEFLRGAAAELHATLSARPSVKGEITLLIGKAEHAEVDDTPVDEAIRALVAAGVPRMDAIKQVAKARGLSKREVLCWAITLTKVPERRRAARSAGAERRCPFRDQLGNHPNDGRMRPDRSSAGHFDAEFIAQRRELPYPDRIAPPM